MKTISYGVTLSVTGKSTPASEVVSKVSGGLSSFSISMRNAASRTSRPKETTRSRFFSPGRLTALMRPEASGCQRASMRRNTATLREKLRSVVLTASAVVGSPNAEVSSTVFFAFASVSTVQAVKTSIGGAASNDTRVLGTATDRESMRNGRFTTDSRTLFATSFPSPFSRIVRSNAAAAASLVGFAKAMVSV